MNKEKQTQAAPTPRPMMRGPGGPMMGTGQKPKNLRKALKDLYGFMYGYRLAFILAIVLGMAGTTFVVLFPNILAKITTEIIKGTAFPGATINLERIAEIGMLLASLYVISATLNYLQSFILTTITQKISYRIRTHISNKINTLPTIKKLRSTRPRRYLKSLNQRCGYHFPIVIAIL